VFKGGSSSSLMHPVATTSSNCNIHQPFRLPRTAGVICQGRGVISHTASTTATTTGRGSGIPGVGKPGENRLTSGVVSKVTESVGQLGHGSKVTESGSGPLRQLQLIDCASLPSHVQQQLYLGLYILCCLSK